MKFGKKPIEKAHVRFLATTLLASFSIPLSTAQEDVSDLLLDTLVVTGSSIAEALKDAPVRTELIDRQTIVKSAARDLAEAV